MNIYNKVVEVVEVNILLPIQVELFKFVVGKRVLWL